MSQTRKTLSEAIAAPDELRAELIQSLSSTGDPVLVRAILVAWREGRLYLDKDLTGAPISFIIEQDKAIRVDNGEILNGIDVSGRTPVETDSKLRKTINNIVSLLALQDPDPSLRRSAALKIGGLQKPETLPSLQSALSQEKNEVVRRAIVEAIAIVELTIPEKEMSAIKRLGDLNAIGSLDRLKTIAQDASIPERQKAARLSVSKLENHLTTINTWGTLFRGLSLGSILLIAALGLAITFGLMGVINMAHGELIAVGAYATFLMERWFSAWFGPAGSTWYFIAAIPFAFLSTALVGLILERTIIQFLYRRPLESLLATWGVSLVLQQLFRLIFGAANVQVNSPAWLQGSIEFNDITFGYNRIFVVGFAVAIVLGTWLLLTRTPFGLLIRAVMQNTAMAACMGVRTSRVNMMTFAFGSGLAGLAGAFLSQIGNVGPSLGQSYIIDCFMTVVVGGVGKIFGCICSALGIGMFNEMLQQLLQNPVLGKILVLVGIILFLQWKPGGIFPNRGRGLEES